MAFVIVEQVFCLLDSKFLFLVLLLELLVTCMAPCHGKEVNQHYYGKGKQRFWPAST
jgi:hypothetical protein